VVILLLKPKQYRFRDEPIQVLIHIQVLSCFALRHIQVLSCFALRYQNLANVYLNRYPGLKINIDAELAYYKVRLTFSFLHLALSTACISFVLSIIYYFVYLLIRLKLNSVRLLNKFISRLETQLFNTASARAFEAAALWCSINVLLVML